MRPPFMMLFLSALCLGGLVAATPLALGPLNADSLDPLPLDIDQLPLRALHGFLKGTPIKALVSGAKGNREDTAYDFFSKDPRLSKLTKAIDFADDAHYFKNRSTRFTFFATPDWAFPHPHDGRCDFNGTDNLVDDEIALFTLTQNCHLGDVVPAIEKLESLGNNGDGDQNERRKKFVKKLNMTYGTKLIIPSFLEGQRLRMRIDQQYSPPSTTINFYAQVVYPNIKAGNGVIHIVNHPILPPLSAFQTLFMLPSRFSILTSALQRVGLTDKVDFRYVHDHRHPFHIQHEGHMEGTSSLTLFAPDNTAFECLPPKLRIFLFSPLGHHVLRKVLEYHIVPGLVIHTDWHFNKSAHANPDDTLALGGHGKHEHHGNVVLDLRLHLPTLLENRSVDTRIQKTEYSVPLPDPDEPVYTKAKFEVDGHHVAIRDAVANNGAIHILSRLLDPRRHRHHHDRERGDSDNSQDNTWDDWEEWLPQWAASIED